MTKIKQAGLYVASKAAPNRKLILTSTMVVAAITAVLTALYISNGFQAGSLNALGRMAIVLFLAVGGAVAVALVARNRHSADNRSLAGVRINKYGVIVLGIAVLAGVAFSIWHGFSAGVAVAAQSGLQTSGWLSTALIGTGHGIVNSPDSFISGWLATIGVVGLLGMVVALFFRNSRNGKSASSAWGIYSVLVTTGVLAHILLI